MTSPTLRWIFPTISIAKRIGILTALCCGISVGAPSPYVMWCDKPAAEWVDGYPIGNGRLGAMVAGNVENERIQLNEDTLWAGGPYDPSNPDALASLPEARRLVFSGKYQEAAQFINQKMMSRPIRQMPYQTVGDLKLGFPMKSPVTNYRRELDLDTAVVTVSYTCNGVKFTREVFASPVDHVIVVRLTADKPGAITFTAGMATPQQATVTTTDGNTLVMSGRNGDFSGIAGALKFNARVHTLTDGGTLTANKESLTISGANSATLLVAAATSYKNYKDVSGDPAAITKTQLTAASAKTFDGLRKAHVAEHQRLFRRVHLELGKAPAPDLPIDQRLALFAKGDDPQLAALFFQFNRYLLISSSRPGSQTANLQGIWNEEMTPAWESKYTININIQMNYWMAEPTNLAECAEPLIRMVEETAQTGRKVAKANWGADGWVCHHNIDLWRATGPIDASWYGFWPTGGAWMCQHLWEQYQFNGDKQYLERIYPTLKEAARFFIDTLVEEPDHGWLVTCPSLSPENAHPGKTSICAGPTIDMQLLRDLFNACIQASNELGTDEAFRKTLAVTRDRLAPHQIGEAGQLQEWLHDWDMKAPNLHFGHVSHMYGVYPSQQLNAQDTPELWAAAKKSLETRGLMRGGWPCAWQINLWARMRNADKSYQQLTNLLDIKHTRSNLFVSPKPFQIDANFGGGAGITEMLLQSGPHGIDLLPALPKEWPDGKITGLRARGGFTVDIEWSEGKVTHYRITSPTPRETKVRMNGKVITIMAEKAA